MHRIIKSHLNSFVQSQGLQADEESVQFEKFATYCVLSSRYSAAFDLDDVSAGAGEDGIDGIAVVIDELVITSAEDANAIFDTPRRNHDVEIQFIQAKRSEGFDLGEFLKFKEAILRFATQSTYSIASDVLSEAREIFDVVVNEVPKVRNGKPSLAARFVTTDLPLHISSSWS